VKCYLSIESGNRFIQDALNTAFSRYRLKDKEKRFVKEMVTGAVKMRGRLEFIRDSFLKGELTRWANACLILGLYQMEFSSSVPDYAAVNEFVTLTGRFENPGAASMVNAVLRNFQRDRDSITYPSKSENSAEYLRDYYSLPKWFCIELVKDFGIEEAEDIARWANSRQAPSVKLFSPSKGKHYSEHIELEGFKAYNRFKGYYRYLGGGDPRDTNLYKSGAIYFQDPSAGLAAKIAEPKEGDIIYDIGAAPGGKTINLYEETKGKAKIFAIEINEGKIKGLKKNLYRLGINSVNIICEDVRALKDKESADIVLVDAPCSGLGTLARNADLRWRIIPEDVQRLSDQQKELLKAASKLVKPKGRLIYSTCTITRKENQEVADDFLQNNKGFVRIPVESEKFGMGKISITEEGDLLVLPSHYGTDGAYACVMEKVNENSR